MLPKESNRILGLKNFYAFFNGNAYDEIVNSFYKSRKMQIHANCRIRRIYFSDRLYSEEELPPEFKLFLPY